MLAQARSRLTRLTADESALAVAQADGPVIIDIRQHIDRCRNGVISGSLWIPATVVLWACDPAYGFPNPSLRGFDQQLIVMCNEGFSSSLVAAALQSLGFSNATDMANGFEGWRGAGLPSQPPAEVDCSVLEGRWPPEP